MTKLTKLAKFGKLVKLVNLVMQKNYMAKVAKEAKNSGSKEPLSKSNSDRTDGEAAFGKRLKWKKKKLLPKWKKLK